MDGTNGGTGTVRRTRDPARTRGDILRIATTEFAEKGLRGARIDEIAAKTATTKRMLYYYFGDKNGLYRAVLENAYRKIRIEESALDVEHLAPEDALRAVAELTFDHHEAHPEFTRLVAGENMLHGENLAAIDDIADLQQPAVSTLKAILDRGRETGVVRADADALDLHALISAFAVFRIANRYTFAVLFSRDLAASAHRDRLRRMIGDIAIAYVRPVESSG